MKSLVDRVPTLLIPILTTLLGFVLGVALFTVVLLIQQSGSWQRYDTPPGDLVRLLAADEYGVVVQTADGTTYEVFCRAGDLDEICWEEVDPPEENFDGNYCQDETFPSVGGRVRDHIETCIKYEYISLTQYVLLENGALWRWGVFINPLGQVAILVRGIIGSTIIGALAGIVIVVDQKLAVVR